MEKTDIAAYVIEEYKKGKRRFENLHILNESFENQILDGIVFDGCQLYANFKNSSLKNAKFLNGGIKTSDFRGADLSGAHFESVDVESTQFARAKTNGVRWIEAYAYGSLSTQEDFEEWIKNYEQL